jgi:hypothetical protein
MEPLRQHIYRNLEEEGGQSSSLGDTIADRKGATKTMARVDGDRRLGHVLLDDGQEWSRERGSLKNLCDGCVAHRVKCSSEVNKEYQDLHWRC